MQLTPVFEVKAVKCYFLNIHWTSLTGNQYVALVCYVGCKNELCLIYTLGLHDASLEHRHRRTCDVFSLFSNMSTLFCFIKLSEGVNARTLALPEQSAHCQALILSTVTHFAFHKCTFKPCTHTQSHAKPKMIVNVRSKEIFRNESDHLSHHHGVCDECKTKTQTLWHKLFRMCLLAWHHRIKSQKGTAI